MQRPLFVFILVLVILGSAAAQEPPTGPVPSTSVDLPEPLLVEATPASVPDVSNVPEPVMIDPPPLEEQNPDFRLNLNHGSTTWIAGDQDTFDWLSFESEGPVSFGEFAELTLGYGLHFLEGPVVTDMPSRLYDFHVGYHLQDSLGPRFRYDAKVQLGAYSDFEGSARDGVRVTGRAVGYFRCRDWIEFVLGVDYLGREDVRILPVGGAILRPHDSLRLDLVFPEPKIAARIGDTDRWLVLGGELGGGTWAVERLSGANELATYHDLRLFVGIEKVKESGEHTGFDVGYIFDRHLEYDSGVGNIDLGDTVMIRWWHIY